ncbi:recombinase RecT [Pararhizobium sp.]|uniref:recombinase RecT n=1 Tax=Pararhizobium sp. TaxID=1977563 RepID=UPI00271DF054|nr:recombinase RecT [Pararhizobium sp.]MDO9416986.1 recombinase RecT [Pararhizobium sp.]
MNQIAERSERLPMDSVGMTSTRSGAKIAPQTLAEVVKFAEVMCRADIALPRHLRGNAGACMAVAMQALEWEMSPFSVASKSYEVGGRIAYEAQLIAAVVNSRSGIKGRLRYIYDGEGAALTCTVTGILDGEECVYKSPTVGSIKTKNSPLWNSDVQQQLGYFSARSWARRHCPEVILGVYDRDEAEEFRGPDNARDITPRGSLDERLAAARETAQQPQGEAEGFSRDHVTRETTDALTGEILDNPDTDGATSPPASSVADGDASMPSAGAEDSPASSAPTLPDDLRQHFIDFARKASNTVQDEHLTDDAKGKAIEDMVANYRDVIPESLWQKLSTVTISLQAVFAGKRTISQAREFIAEMLDCTVEDVGGAA